MEKSRPAWFDPRVSYRLEDDYFIDFASFAFDEKYRQVTAKIASSAACLRYAALEAAITGAGLRKSFSIVYDFEHGPTWSGYYKTYDHTVFDGPIRRGILEWYNANSEEILKAMSAFDEYCKELGYDLYGILRGTLEIHDWDDQE